jgi:3-phenylpropionate/cinnamic acid dioxygenase small subunit
VTELVESPTPTEMHGEVAYELQPFPERGARRRDIAPAVNEFFVDESAALDDNRHDEWLAMLANGFIYQLPVPLLREDPFLARHSDRAMLFEATKQTLSMKFGRVGQHHAWSDRPGATTRHMVGGVQVFETAVAEEYRVHSNVFVCWNRGRDESAFASARREDVLRRLGPSEFVMLRRRVLLDHEVASHQQLSIIY